jgi:hypothetical protein
MIQSVFKYRFLHIDHLSALMNRSYKKVHGRLLKLVRHHFLARIEIPFEKHIYVIGREGITVLAEQGTASRSVIGRRLRHHELKELFLKHQMMLVDLHCMLELASHDTDIALAAWREGKDFWDRVAVWRGREWVSLPVCPDAFFVLRDHSRLDGRNRLNFFLEADRSTTTHRRFENKLVAYYEYLLSGGHTRKHGIKTFRVVTFTLTPERARNLAAIACEILPPDALKYFLFASTHGLSLVGPAPILSDLFIDPRLFPVRLVPSLRQPELET